MFGRLKLLLRKVMGGEGRARIYGRVGRVEARVVELQIQLSRRDAEANARLRLQLAQLLERQEKLEASIAEVRASVERLGEEPQPRTRRGNPGQSGAGKRA